MTYTFLQNYWWCLIALLGGLLVFLMFVQGANVQLANKSLTAIQKRMVVNSTGRKWELAFTTLVTFGGAFFASFPLFYSTSFSGAYWVWILLLVTYVFQAVSYEFMHKKGNILGVAGFSYSLAANGILAPFLIGTAVGTFFTGSHFTVNKNAIIDAASPVISTWDSCWRGLEALAQPHAVLLGLSLVGLATIMGALYVINNVEDSNLETKMRKAIKIASIPFVACFVIWTIILLCRSGFAVNNTGTVFLQEYKYLCNLMQMPIVLVMFVLGTVCILVSIWMGGFTASRKGIWPGGAGTVMAVMAIFFLAGFNNTAYYPSVTDLQSSLTLSNSCASKVTLQVMTYISFIIPAVLAYIIYAWKQMDKKRITGKEMEENGIKY